MFKWSFSLEVTRFHSANFSRCISEIAPIIVRIITSELWFQSWWNNKKYGRVWGVWFSCSIWRREKLGGKMLKAGNGVTYSTSLATGRRHFWSEWLPSHNDSLLGRQPICHLWPNLDSRGGASLLGHRLLPFAPNTAKRQRNMNRDWPGMSIYTEPGDKGSTLFSKSATISGSGYGGLKVFH